MAPKIDNYRIIWADDFNGTKGNVESASNWNRIVKSDNPNQEAELFTDYASNAHLSGDGQLYIVPIRKGNNPSYWTSARLESTKSWSAPAGKAVIFQAEIRVPDFTGSPAKFAGLWPSFWTLGASHRAPKNVSWPKCGEWDIFEVTNKMGNRNQGTLHFTDAKGNHNGELKGSVNYQGGQYHTWALKADRRNGDWRQQRLGWYLDGKEYHHVTGAMVGTEQQWHELAWSPYYIVLQVAVGGAAESYPGVATDNTVSGFESAMRVKHVAVYESE